MNKKFSTLMAGLMLASAFSVASAQEVVKKYETNKAYWLGVKPATGEFNLDPDSGDPNGRVIAVVSNPSSPQYGQLILVDKDVVMKDICAIKAATWTISFTQPTDGTAPKFVYVNKATGLTLSLDPDDVGYEAYIKGGSSEWLNTPITDNTGAKKALPFADLRSFYEANKVVYLKTGTAANPAGENLFGTAKTASINYTTLTVAIAEKNSELAGAVEIAPVQPMILPLNADDLNSQLGKMDLSVISNDQKWFNLYFNQDVTSDAEKNLFAATPLRATQIYYKDGRTDATVGYTTSSTYVDTDKEEKDNIATPYVQLLAKDLNSYIVVDTAYHTGTESIGKLPKFTYAKGTYEGTNNVVRNEASFRFAFAYNPFTDAILIKSHGYYQKTTATHPIKITGAGTTYDGNDAYTWWGYKEGNSGSAATEDPGLLVSNAYVRLAKLASVRELTVADNSDDTNKKEESALSGSAGWNDNNNEYGMSTTVKMTKEDQTYSPASVADGLYLIKLHTSGFDKDGNKREALNGDYLIASLGGNFGYASQAKNQDYDHMPAAQWVVERVGVSENAPIKITNREFFDQYANGAKNYFAGKDKEIQGFNAGDGKIFFTTGVFANDTLEFIPVSAASKKDAKLGYKYVDEEQASMESYYFNYLHGLTQDKGLNTPSDKDSLVRVDETGAKMAFRLVPVIEDDSYGVQDVEGVANLVRNAYFIEAYDNLKFAEDGISRYLTYDEASKKYMMSVYPTAYFLKENNCADGTHYYALVEAKLYGGKFKAQEGWQKDMYDPVNVTGKIMNMYPAQFAGLSTTSDADKVWSFYELTQEKKTYYVNTNKVEITNVLTSDIRNNISVVFYDKDGEPVVADASEDVDLYAYMPNPNNNNVITLTQLTFEDKDGATDYYAMNPDVENNRISAFTGINTISSKNYSVYRLSVDDNTLDLFRTQLDNKEDWEDELRVSAFEAAVNDSPLYRRFNGENGEYGTAANAPLNLKFYRYNNDQEYLFENYSSENKYRDGINDKEISFLGVNNAMQFAESETRSYTMFIDTAYVRANTRMPQYLIGIRPEVIPGDTTWCNATSAHHHETLADSLACDHTVIDAGFTRAMYLFNAQDSVDVKNYDYQGKAAYGAQGYTRLAFKDAVHAQDTLYILKPGVTNEQLKATNLKDGSLFTKKIALDNNKHKNVVFQFRKVSDDSDRFLIESEAEQNGKAVLNKSLSKVCIAPMRGGWVKIQNGVPVIARFQDFQEAIAQAEVFDVTDEIQYEATDNEEIAVEGVSVVAGDGQVTIMGAAGKNVTITNILGKVIASQVIASDNATIAVPAGIVAVAVEGEAAVKAIVK